MTQTKSSLSINSLQDAIFFLKEGKYKPVILIINGLCSYEEAEPSKNTEESLKEAIYIQKALEIREVAEIRKKLYKTLNSVRSALQQERC